MKSKTIMMNKYGLSVGAAYDEQFTLLEPNNFIPSWEAGDEEKKEVSNALKNLREKFDRIHRQVAEKAESLKQLEVSLNIPKESKEARSESFFLQQRALRNLLTLTHFCNG